MIRPSDDRVDVKISLSGHYHTSGSRLDQRPVRNAVDPAGVMGW